MKYVVRTVPILAVIAILLGVMQLVKPDQAQAASVAAIRIGVLVDSAFETSTYATSKNPSRTLQVQVTDADHADSDVDEITLTSLKGDSSSTAYGSCAMRLRETGAATGIFRGTFTITETTGDQASSSCDGTAGSAAGTAVIYAVAGDEIEAVYDDPSPAQTVRRKVTIENDVPSIADLTPETATFTDDSSITVSVDATDDAAVIASPSTIQSIALLVSDEQCTNSELFDSNGRPTVTIASLADATLSAVTGVNCGSDSTGTAIFEVLFTSASGADADQVTAIEDASENTIGYTVSGSVSIIDTGDTFGEKYVTAIAVDKAGNVGILDVDETDAAVVFAKYTGDTADPTIDAIRTGVLYNADDGDLDTNERNWIQVIFADDTDLNGDTVEAEDFVVDGYTVSEAKWHDAAVISADYDATSLASTADKAQVRRMVFLKVTPELAPDATPTVTIVPDGVQDAAGNTQSSASADAVDAIGPGFTVDSQSATLAGVDDEIVIQISSDEALGGSKRPTVTVTQADDIDSDPNTLTASVKTDGTNAWKVTIDDPDATAMFSIYISGEDAAGNANTLGLAVVDTTPADDVIDTFYESHTTGDVSDDAIYFEGDISLSIPDTDPVEDEEVTFRDPFFITVDFGTPAGSTATEAEDAEYAEDSNAAVTLTSATLDGVDVLADASSADDTKWLIAIRDISIGEHELVVEAEDTAGNELADETFTLEFTVAERADFSLALNPGWNLVSFPGTPVDAGVDAVVGGTPVTTVYSYDPTTPGGWLVAVREGTTTDDLFTGSLTTINANNGYWMLTDSFKAMEVDIPALAGGAVGAATPASPPALNLVAGWNLIPILDVSGDLAAGNVIDSDIYFEGLEDEVSRIYSYDTVENAWDVVVRDGTKEIVADQDSTGLAANEGVAIGKAYWVYLTAAGVLIP